MPGVSEMCYTMYTQPRPSPLKGMTGTAKVWQAEEREMLQPLCNLTWKASRLHSPACEITSNVTDAPSNYRIRGSYLAANTRRWHIPWTGGSATAAKQLLPRPEGVPTPPAAGGSKGTTWDHRGRGRAAGVRPLPPGPARRHLGPGAARARAAPASQGAARCRRTPYFEAPQGPPLRLGRCWAGRQAAAAALRPAGIGPLRQLPPILRFPACRGASCRRNRKGAQCHFRCCGRWRAAVGTAAAVAQVTAVLSRPEAGRDGGSGTGSGGSLLGAVAGHGCCALRRESTRVRGPGRAARGSQGQGRQGPDCFTFSLIIEVSGFVFLLVADRPLRVFCVLARGWECPELNCSGPRGEAENWAGG